MGSKYPILRPGEIAGALAKKGFQYKSRKSSHAKYTNGTRTCIIPTHPTVARGTLKSILDQAGIDIDDFLILL